MVASPHPLERELPQSPRTTANGGFDETGWGERRIPELAGIDARRCWTVSHAGIYFTSGEKAPYRVPFFDFVGRHSVDHWWFETVRFETVRFETQKKPHARKAWGRKSSTTICLGG